MESLTLTLLERFDAIIGNKTIARFHTRKVQALLIYLVMEPAAHRRESLMTLLWPRMPERSARQNLRQVLYNLREGIPELSARDGESETAVPLLLTNRQTIQINPIASM